MIRDPTIQIGYERLRLHLGGRGEKIPWTKHARDQIRL